VHAARCEVRTLRAALSSPAVGETRVDLQHLLEDLRDAYSGPLEQTILTEVVANALDSGARRIAIHTSAAAATLTVVDDGRGMKRRELARYHDVAASTKPRGDAIGFAGVGIKLGLLVSRTVVTETQRGKVHAATEWFLKSKHRAPWKWIPVPGLTGARGTAVRLALDNPLSPLLDAGYVEETVRHHFEPLFDGTFDELLRRHYPEGVTFEINGERLPRLPVADEGRVAVAIRLGRRRLPSAAGYLQLHASALPQDRQGIAISTFGKVIKRGWEWLGLAPASAARVSGLVEAPDLAACLTLNKSDFIRSGPRGASYLAYRKAIQEVVSRQLAAWGDSPDADARPRPQRLERDLARVLEDLADDFPLLRSLVDRRPGGQKRLPMPGRGSEKAPGPLVSDTGDEDGREPRTEPSGESGAPQESGEPPASLPEDEGAPPTPPADATGHQVATLSTVAGRKRPARYGLLVQFEAREGDTELGRLVDNTLWINDAHPAYRRAAASRSVGYHIALSVALALAPLAVDPAREHAFVTQFLAHWGGARSAGRGTRGARRG
jgi:Histidine kinase-, DNA gyrase B-, and HSP90-like ATPase